MHDEQVSVATYGPTYLVYVLDILCGGDGLSVVFGAVRIDVPGIELKMLDSHSSRV